MTDYYTGGCQCGAVRFRVAGPLRHASICNCRMCQKAKRTVIGEVGGVRPETYAHIRAHEKSEEQE